MSEVTLESLAARVAALETAIGESKNGTHVKDWRTAVGMFRGSEVMRQIDAEGRAIREADRGAARSEESAP